MSQAKLKRLTPISQNLMVPKIYLKSGLLRRSNVLFTLSNNALTKAGEDAVEPEEVPEASGPEKDEVEDQEMEKPVEEKVSKIRNRMHGSGLQSPLPRPSLKHKKSSNYLVWAIPAALAALILVVLSYYYTI